MIKQNPDPAQHKDRGSRKALLLLFIAPLFLFFTPLAGISYGSDTAEQLNPLKLTDNSSPRDTLRSFIDLTDRMVNIALSEGDNIKTYTMYIGLEELLDFSSTPFSSDRYDQVKYILMLRAILGRIELPQEQDIPGKEEVELKQIQSWTIPGTRLRITQETEGHQVGEFLFSADTIENLELSYQRVAAFPYKPGEIAAYETFLKRRVIASVDHDELKERLSGIDTSSPRATLVGFLRQINKAYQISREAEAGLKTEPPEISTKQGKIADKRALSHLKSAVGALDLSKEPEGQRQFVGLERALMLKEIFDRVLLPNITSIPNRADVLDASQSKKTVFFQAAGMPIRIEELKEGERAGSFLFTARTVEKIPQIYKRLYDLPYREHAAVDFEWEYGDADRISPDFYESYVTTAGNLVPSATIVGQIVLSLPASLYTLYLDQTAWQWIGLVLLLAASLIVIYLIYVLVARVCKRVPSMASHWLSITAPIAGAVLFGNAISFASNGLGVTGNVLYGFDFFMEVIVLGFIAHLSWRICMAVADSIITLPKISDGDIDASLIRIIFGFVAVILGIAVFINGLQNLGINALPLFAGLGVSGLAVALAIRPTLENLIGGIILFLDRPIVVGDYCSFGTKKGTVESIGVRSTKLRGLDRTLITIPNAQLADLQLINWARCDMMLISALIGVRYETEPDQLRYVLVKFREMLHAHPKIDRETVRVRFGGYGACSLDITVRIYALTREWNEFHAIREDVFLRMHDIVKAAGTDFAFPSQTLYMTKDSGLDKELGKEAIGKVHSWRENQKLPFPRLDETQMDKLQGTLDYPPKGSVELRMAETEKAEPLSRDDNPTATK